MNEMAIKTAQYPKGSFNMKQLYKNLKDNLINLKSEYTSKKYNVDKYENNNLIYFFISKDDNFKGGINGILKNKTFYIKNSEKDESTKGFYSIILPIILEDKNINTIKSDKKLSPSVIKSYEKIVNSNSYLKDRIKVETKDGIKDFNTDLLLNDFNNVVIIESVFKGLSFKTFLKSQEKENELFNISENSKDIKLLGDLLENLN